RTAPHRWMDASCRARGPSVTGRCVAWPSRPRREGDAGSSRARHRSGVVTPELPSLGDPMAKTELKTRLLAAAALSGVMGLAQTAHAQTADAQAATSEQTSTVDDIVVTAQLREQDPIEVPFALTAYS